jgi:hypothetical protein
LDTGLRRLSGNPSALIGLGDIVGRGTVAFGKIRVRFNGRTTVSAGRSEMIFRWIEVISPGTAPDDP